MTTTEEQIFTCDQTYTLKRKLPSHITLKKCLHISSQEKAPAQRKKKSMPPPKSQSVKGLLQQKNKRNYFNNTIYKRTILMNDRLHYRTMLETFCWRRYDAHYLEHNTSLNKTGTCQGPKNHTYLQITYRSKIESM